MYHERPTLERIIAAEIYKLERRQGLTRTCVRLSRPAPAPTVRSTRRRG
jgi:hypothetical protein